MLHQLHLTTLRFQIKLCSWQLIQAQDVVTIAYLKGKSANTIKEKYLKKEGKKKKEIKLPLKLNPREWFVNNIQGAEERSKVGRWEPSVAK